MELLLAPFAAFVALPFLALVPAGGFWLLWRRARSRSPGSPHRLLLGSAVLWGIYTLYEGALWIWAQGVVAPIRIDLFLVAPLLYLVSVLALVAAWRRA